MDTKALVKLPIHDHLLRPSPRFVKTYCGACRVQNMIYGGYICSDPMCLQWFHKDCAEAPSEINHSFHPQHPLLLTIYEKDYTCDLCEKDQVGFSSYAGYCCSICDFNLDLICGMKPPSLTIEHPIWHDHPLVFSKTPMRHIYYMMCQVCRYYTDDGPSYKCRECVVYFHLDCIQLPKEVNHPCHSKHPVKFIEYKSLMEDAEKTCRLCGDNLTRTVYHCSVCNFTICLDCSKIPPPLVIDHQQTHEHPLTLFSKRLSTTCDYCGNKELLRPYMCFQCDFVIDGWWLGLPRVININRHDHRISFTQHLGPGYLKCHVCHKSISQYTGGYSCSICPTYAVHSQCAINSKVWDGVELEGITEIIEDIAPFKVVGDNLIRHISHDKHILRLQADNNIIYDQLTRCEACIHPVGFEPIYSCEDCCFILHEKCANLPLKKRLIFDSVPFTLTLDGGNNVRKVLDCKVCEMFSIGFKYTSQRNMDVDIHCGSLSEPLVHKCHPHPLYFYDKEKRVCDACQNYIDGVFLGCDECEFDLCIQCSSIPERLRYSNHEHPIILCCGEEASGQYWCDICEKKLDSSEWFYTCDDCGVTIHVECIFGDFSRLLPGCIIDYHGYEFEVILNNHNTRPKCKTCLSRCNFSVFLKDLEDNEYVCSRLCFMKLFD